MSQHQRFQARASVPLSKRQPVYVTSKRTAFIVYGVVVPRNSVVGMTVEPIAKGAVGWFDILIRNADDLRRLKAMPSVDWM